MSDATIVNKDVKEDGVEAAFPISKAEEEMFKDVVNADLISDATRRDGEEQHCQPIRSYNKKDDYISDAEENTEETEAKINFDEE